MISLEEAFVELAGYPNKVFNCVNSLNVLIIIKNSYLTDIIGKFNLGTHIVKLNNMLYTIIFIYSPFEYLIKR